MSINKKPIEICLKYIDKLPEGILPVPVDERVGRASVLKSGDKIVDCNFRLVTIRKTEQEIAEYAVIETDEDEDEFNRLHEALADDEIMIALNQFLLNCKKSYKISDITIYDTDNQVHSFVNCCHFEDEHALWYSDVII